MWRSDRSKVNSSQHLWQLSGKLHGAYFWLLKVSVILKWFSYWKLLYPFLCFSPYWDVCLLPRASKTFWINPKSLKHCLTAFISLPQSQPSYTHTHTEVWAMAWGVDDLAEVKEVWREKDMPSPHCSSSAVTQGQAPGCWYHDHSLICANISVGNHFSAAVCNGFAQFLLFFAISFAFF